MKNTINPETEYLLEAISKSMPQSILLYGERGSGVVTAVEYLIEGLTGRTIINIYPESSASGASHISIESIRDLFSLIKSHDRVGRVIVIHEADKLTLPAQHAFLKLLEEPKSDTSFILHSHSPQDLIDTIRSRTQFIRIRNISNHQSSQLLDFLDIDDEIKRKQIMYLADGLLDDITRLARDDEYFKRRTEELNLAKTLLTDNTYETLELAQKIRSDRDKVLRVLQSALLLGSRSMSQKPQKRLLDRLAAIEAAYSDILANGNIRLILAQLVI